jgi:hypothetical protein
MVEEEALAQVHRRDLRHFVFGELEVEYIEDFSNAVRAHGLGDGDDVALDAPAQDARGAPVTGGTLSWPLLCLPTVPGCRGFGGCGFHDAVEVPGEGALEAAADVAVGLALKGAPGFVGPGFAWHRRRVTLCRARLSARSPPRSRRCLVRWPLLASRGATPASEANVASLLTRPGWDQLISSWAATTGPTPGSASSAGPAGCAWMRRASSGSMSASWPVRNRMRAVMDCSVSTVIRCSTVAAAAAAVQGARCCSGATTMRLLRSLMALVRLTSTAWRVADSVLIPSRRSRRAGRSANSGRAGGR